MPKNKVFGQAGGAESLNEVFGQVLQEQKRKPYKFE